MSTPPATGPLTSLAWMQRLIVPGAGDRVGHLARLGALPEVAGPDLIAMATRAGLAGRGGAAFPLGPKLASVAARVVRAGGGTVVANGAEGEPASRKDRALLVNAPHLVLDGLLLAARATGADSAAVYAPADLLDAAVRPAMDDRRDTRGVACVESPPIFLAGESSVAASVVAGGRALPSPSRRGSASRPTLVANVETLASLALVARFGPGWFATLGTREEPGTRLVTVSGAVRAPGVYEVPGGSALGDLVAGAGGPTGPLDAVLVGGYHGAWVPWAEETAALPLSVPALSPYGAAPGAGVLIALPADRCGVVGRR